VKREPPQARHREAHRGRDIGFRVLPGNSDLYLDNVVLAEREPPVS